jgi:Cdc37 Hsp90 binding domain
LRDFASIGLSNYLGSLRFISNNPKIVAESHIDALVAEAIAAVKAGQSARSQACIHQALLLRHCREVGSNNIRTFFLNLIAGDGKTKESFLIDVKSAYASIQARAPYQAQELTTESQGRRFPLTSQLAEGRVSQNLSAYTQEPTQGQTPIAQGPGGRMYYLDPERNLLRPASSRHHEPDRYRSPRDPVESYSKTTGVDAKEGRESATKAEAGGGDDEHTLGIGSVFHRIAAPDYAEPLPTLPENRRLEATKIREIGGSVERLDYREYLPVYQSNVVAQMILIY